MLSFNVLKEHQTYLEIENSRLYRRIDKETEQFFICNRTNNRTFGVLCEYQFSQSSFEDTVLSQYGKKLRYLLSSQLFGKYNLLSNIISMRLWKSLS